MTALPLQVLYVQEDSLAHGHIEAAAILDKWRVLLMEGNLNKAKQHDHHSIDIKDRVLRRPQPQVRLGSGNCCLVRRTARGRPRQEGRTASVGHCGAAACSWPCDLHCSIDVEGAGACPPSIMAKVSINHC